MNIDFEKLVAEAVAAAVEKRIGALLGQAPEVPHGYFTVAAPTFSLMAPEAPSTKKAKTFTIKYPPRTTLRRGRKEALKHFRASTSAGQAALLAWESLARDGVFASKASRADMTQYLVSELKLSRGQASAVISNCLKVGLLTGEVE